MTNLELDDITIAEYPREYVDRLILKHHYLDTIPTVACIYRYVISGGIRHGIIGAAMWGKPTARMEDQTDTLELQRFWTEDYTPKNTESYALSRMIKDIDERGTHSRLIAYSSSGENHDGGIYRATNWEYVGERETSTGDGWANRPNRATNDQSKKHKFVYHL
jgi:hypothetical protein